MLRGTVPLLKMALATTSPLKRVALILFGKSFVPTIAWERCFFREGVRAGVVKRSVLYVSYYIY